MKDTYTKLTILLLWIVAGAASAFAQGAEEALKHFEGKVLVLRHPLEGSSQEYDADGKVLRGGAEGPWTVYGGVLIDRIALAPDKLRFEGRRILFLFLNQHFTAMEFKLLKDRRDPPFAPAVQLEIRLDRSLDSPEQAQAVLSRIFALNTSDLLDSVPELWRKCVAEQLVYDPSQNQEAEFRWQAPPPRASKPVQKGPMVAPSNPEGVFYIGDGVTAPRPTFTPEPEYSAIARYERFQGELAVNVIVGADGNVHQVRIVRPLGLGLDDSARSMLATWRFIPAMREGKPVAVEMNIEVAFNLH